MVLYGDCRDCDDGSCIGAECVQAPEGYAFCCACHRPPCVVTVEEFRNPNPKCAELRKNARDAIVEFELLLFGEPEEVDQ